MVVRTAKLVLAPEWVERFLEGFRELVHTQTSEVSGLLGMYLLRDRQNPQQYFVQSHWDTRPAMEAYLRQPDYRLLMLRLREPLVERMRSYDCSVLRSEPRGLPRAPGATAVTRLTRLVEHPSLDGVLTEEFDRYTDSYSRLQPGCLSVELYRQFEPANHYWVQSWWATPESLGRHLQSQVMTAVRDAVRAELSERAETWDLSLAVDDPRRPFTP